MERGLQRVLSTLFIGTLALALWGCPPETVKIGAVLPLSGNASDYGQAVKKGIELAAEEIAQSGTQSNTISLEVVDTGSDPETAKDLLGQQFNSGAIAVLGGVISGEAKAMVEVLDRYDRVLLSPTASTPELTGISRNFYRIIPSDHTSANKMAQAAWQSLGVKTIVVIAEEQPYAKGIQGVFVPSFEGYGGEILEVIGFPPNTSDLEALVSRAVSLKPDAVYLAGYAEGIGSMIRELRKLRFKGRILTTSAFASTGAIDRVGDAAAGVYLTQIVFELDSDHAHIKKFVEAYRSKYNEDPDIYAAYGYDAMRVLAAAANDRPALPGEIKKGFRDAVDDFPGVTGSIKFDEKGDVRKFPRLYRISKDLLLVDFNDAKRKRDEEIRKRKEALQKQLEDLKKQATGISG